MTTKSFLFYTCLLLTIMITTACSNEEITSKDFNHDTDIEQKMNTILARHEAPYINGRFDFQLIPMKGSHFRTDIEDNIDVYNSIISCFSSLIVCSFSRSIFLILNFWRLIFGFKSNKSSIGMDIAPPM